MDCRNWEQPKCEGGDGGGLALSLSQELCYLPDKHYAFESGPLGQRCPETPRMRKSFNRAVQRWCSQNSGGSPAPGGMCRHKGNDPLIRLPQRRGASCGFIPCDGFRALPGSGFCASLSLFLPGLHPLFLLYFTGIFSSQSSGIFMSF